jgi:serine/threonine-protein kinase
MTIEDPLLGHVLHGRYRITERLDAGSMGVVYRAERVGLGRTVVVKILHESYSATADGLRRFEVEARAMSRLSHPNCVAVNDFGVDAHAPYLVMDFVDGRSLRALIRAEGPLLPTRAVRIIEQIVAGLSHAHGQSIVHRDIKPENIVVTHVEGQGEQVKILDFGLAKLRDEKSVTSGIALGTPGYMSPEQTIGRSVDARADIYGVGIILYELLAGKKPFQSDDVFEVMRMHRETPPPSLASSAPAGAVFSTALEDLVQRALAKDPDDRFASMDELALALAQTPEAKGQSGKRGRGWILPAAVAGSIAVVGAVLLATGQRSEPSAPPAAAPAPAAASAPTETPPTSPRAEPPTPPPSVPPDAAPASAAAEIARLRELAAGGDRKQALLELDALRARQPRRAEVYLALGNLYTEDLNWEAAVGAYSTAIVLEPANANEPRLIADIVQALGDNKAHKRAANVLTTQIGKAALPRLEEATRSASAALRTRAEGLRDELAAIPD